MQRGFRRRISVLMVVGRVVHVFEAIFPEARNDMRVTHR